jgi:phosphopantothenoylcysteine decarboxylase/phosphopantothenate--cysteine ligase
MLHNRKILVGVTGGIAAYKACELVRLLMKNRAEVHVIMTQAATRFVTPLTFEALTGKAVATDLFSLEGESGGHLSLVRDADLFIIAPATANCLGKLACGLANDLLSTAALAYKGTMIVCPAMNPRMWENRSVQENVKTLQQHGIQVIPPEEGSMASPAEEPGVGRLPEPQQIFERVCQLLPPRGPLSGRDFIITAGPTQEAIDPVRVITNLSSGQTGYALAAEARRRGANVHLIAGNMNRPTPPGVELIPAETTAEMLAEIEKRFVNCDALIMAAAPSDFKAAQRSQSKLKKDETDGLLHLTFDKTPDILKTVARRKKNQVVVGFALETEAAVDHARRKLDDKNLDLIIANQPHAGEDAGIGRPSIQGTILDAHGNLEELPVLAKSEFARIVLDRIQSLIPGI